MVIIFSGHDTSWHIPNAFRRRVGHSREGIAVANDGGSRPQVLNRRVTTYPIEKSWKWTKKNPVSKMAFRGKSLNQTRGSLNLWDFPACDWISALENGMISVAGMSQSRWHLWRFVPLTLHGYATRPWNLRTLYSTLQFQYIQYMFCIGLLYFIIIQRWPNLLP